jgi:hypothetical protein
MDLFLRYRLSEKSAAEHILQTRRLGLVPLFVPLALMLARTDAPGPGLWSAFGLAAGIHLVLWGGFLLGRDSPATSSAGRFLADRSSRWFPLLLFGSQSAFAWVLLAVLWPTLSELGFPATTWLDANLILLALAIPGYRLAREAALVAESPRFLLAEEFFRYLLIALSALFLLSCITPFIMPPGQRAPEEMVPVLLVLWIGGSLTVLVCLALFIEHALRQKKTP